MLALYRVLFPPSCRGMSIHMLELLNTTVVQLPVLGCRCTVQGSQLCYLAHVEYRCLHIVAPIPGFHDHSH